MPVVALGPVGFFGKVPARGDFVRRRLPPALVHRWEDWLQQSLAASQAALGHEWLDLYLTAPLWRFVQSGEAAGLLMPSIDLVGRYFPLLLAIPLPPGVATEPFADLNSNWYASLEDVALTALEPRQSFEAFEQALATLMPPHLPANGSATGPVGLWWTNGSPAVAPCRRALAGLPPPSGFAALLDGRWERHGWGRIP